MNHFGEYLRRARETANLTQAEVAGKLGLKSPQYISNVERGLCPISLDQLAKLVPMYHLDAHELVDLMVEQHRELVTKRLLPRKKRMA